MTIDSVIFSLPSVIMLIDMLCRKVIHTVGPKYAVKYHTAAESALSHCYRSCLELLVENGLERYIKSFDA
jgi:O-acetyl-ADP-ribose deacetylase (regulator of RNase III)